MRISNFIFLILTLSFASSGLAQDNAPEQDQNSSPKPLRALLIAGGCCHEYASQQESLCKGIQARANVQVDVYWTDDSSTSPLFPLYDDPQWSQQYDVIIHDECAADVKDITLINRIVQAHQKIPAVHLHCAMHSFRSGTDVWFKHLGLQSSGHGPQEPIEINFVDTDHPITKTLKDWTTIKEELYNNVKMFDAHPLANGKQAVGRGTRKRVDEAVVVWTNEKQGARSFSTTIGHNTKTVEDPRYLELVTRGLLWTCDKLNPEYLKPFDGKGELTFIDKNAPAPTPAQKLGDKPDNATLVKPTASSTQSGHDAWHAIDGDDNTRWCADGGSFPQSLQLEFKELVQPSKIQIDWEFNDQWYRYVVEGSADGENWTSLLDNRESKAAIKGAQKLAAGDGIKFVRLTAEESQGGWCSIRELRLIGEGIGLLWPGKTLDGTSSFVPRQPDLYQNQGNIPPRIVKLTAEQEAEILKDVTVPEDFDVTVFASPPAVNYPVFVAASVDGTLYVSSDGNGSLGRNQKRGRVIRLKDTDGDGRADETKVFCEIDAPRGLVWDHDRLYVMHPPHLSAFIDHDGDGKSDEQKILVKNLAFDYDKRPADHTTNGVSLGVDGWLYIAGGDFGFIDAEGTDGNKLTHRGGGVIRVRPDGTGLEVFSTGTRNILEVAISPQMEMFARDNTNDGGGWDVRLHHFTGTDDHGYPRLYKNFNDECVAPLADYGGGSGCGAVYIDEPGFGKWNNAPFTADWGTGSLYRHTVAPHGATYQETAAPQSFIKMTRPTDADVDGNSRVYCASWRGATFDWAGPEVGYIVCVKPKDFKPDPLPNFADATEKELVDLFQSESYRRRMEAQRELLRRGSAAHSKLLDQGLAAQSESRTLLRRLQTDATVEQCVAALSHRDPIVVHTAVRCLAQRNAYDECLRSLDGKSSSTSAILRALAMMHQPPVVDGLINRLSRSNLADVRQPILAALCRLHFQEGNWNGDSWGTRPDTRGPYYQPEPWSESEKISAVLHSTLEAASPADAVFLIDMMQKNRIPANHSLDRLIRMASTDQELLPTVVKQLAAADEMPDLGVELLIKVAGQNDVPPNVLADAIVGLTKTKNANTPTALLSALSQLEKTKRSRGAQARARKAFADSLNLGDYVVSFADVSESADSAQGTWADIALISIASNNTSSPEAIEHAAKVIEAGWQSPDRRRRLIEAVTKIRSHALDEKIWAAQDDENETVAQAARSAIARLEIKPRLQDDSPLIGTLTNDIALSTVIENHGDPKLGQQVFTRANCGACHTVRQDETSKGPFLGNIAKTYKRPDLAAAILEPSKTIAQGFVTTVIVTIDGQQHTGFVTAELNDRVTMRDGEGKELAILKDDIEARKTSPISVMPTGVMNEYSVHELSSLLDYLESLAGNSEVSSTELSQATGEN